MPHSNSNRPRAIQFLFENSVFLIAGAFLALVWANLDASSYNRFLQFDLTAPFTRAEHHDAPLEAAGHGDPDHEPTSGAEEHAAVSEGGQGESAHASGHHFNLHWLINDVLMALFFAIAAKEVWEALLPGGALSDPRKAATPLLATLGGILGPASLYVAGVLMFSSWSELGSGWAVPCATDIAFSYLVARLIFGPGHPAIAFLLLLAIADDAAGLIILAIFYPQAPLAPAWLLLAAGAILLGFAFRKLRLQSFWWYLLIPGTMSWLSFYFAGIHPALGLVPIIPCMPHASTDLGIFARDQLGRHDTLNEFEHWWKNPVELILGFFGLVNAGVGFSSVGVGTWLVLVGLIVGKPLGITLFTWIGVRALKLEIPGGMSYRHVFTLGVVAGIGFTVALFVSTAAFPLSKFPQETLDAVKMGALGSFFAAILAFAVARMLGIRPVSAEATAEAPKGDEPDAEAVSETGTAV
ncbi:MAG: Na+/H+ antiporter NhaA [Pirellulaceae bacterium]